MNVLRFVFIFAYFSFQLALTEQSTRERIALHKKWLQQREQRKKLMMQERLANNRTIDDYWLSYYHYKNDLNSTLANDKKSRRKPLQLDFQLKSKRKNQHQQQQQQQQQQNSVLPNELFDISTSTTATTTTTTFTTLTPLTSTFVSAKTTTAGITKSTDELRVNNHENSTTTEINAKININDRMNLNETVTNQQQINEITSTTTENSITYNVTAYRPSKGVHQMAANRVNGKISSNAIWGRWQKWTKCSRSCGGGVMSQSRQCLNRDTTIKNRTSNECIGLQKRYRICNEQSCPDNELDFREQQCIFYNNQSFHGKKYSWESYIVDESECELNCKPIGMDYFATLKDRVIDGTSCFFPIDFVRQNHSERAMCVEGICKAIHNSGILTGAFMNNGAIRCGSTVCNQISKTFSENPLPMGYYNITTIPVGASNISILELKNSDNYLVLKREHSFIINGDNIISDSGVYRAAGTVFDYRRIDDAIEASDENSQGVTEWITATGPLKEAVNLMVLIQSKNPGIKYEYVVPVNPLSLSSGSTSDDVVRSIEMEADMPPDAEAKQTESEKRKKKHSYTWRVVSFSTCSKTCGGGSLTPIIRCVREGTSKFFNHKRCAHQTKPVLNENILRCNTQPCPAYWKVEEWTACNCGLPNEHDYQTREIKCVQELSSGVVIHVNVEACLEKQPDTRQNCNCPKQQIDYYRHSHKGREKNHHHHHYHHHNNNHHHSQPITLIGNSTIGKRAHVLEGRKPGTWIASNWSEQCSTKCGEGTQYRSIFCDRSAKNDRCDIRLTPETTRSCTETSRCNIGDWFIGPWSNCFGDCFNLMRSRSVLCIKDDQIVSDSLCIDSNNVENTTKPLTIEKCELKDVSYCRPKWHFSEWTECSRSCGSGTQRRTVKCFEQDVNEAILKESDMCRYSERPQAFRSCNTHECDGDTSDSEETTEATKFIVPTKKHVEPKVRLIQNDSTPKCEDRYKNCVAVVKAKLCTYDYYIENCCASCKESIELGY